jgi:hypothetical protein
VREDKHRRRARIRVEVEPDSLDALLADLVSAPRNDGLMGLPARPHRADRGLGVLGSDRCG